MHEIACLDDPLYDDWLDIYQKSFPLSEQMLIGELNKSLRTGGPAGERSEIYLIALDGAGAAAGIVRLDIYAELDAAALWYLAVAPQMRSGGIGSWIYDELIMLLKSRCARKALVFEVESPEQCHTPQDRTLAERRIAFYRRRGAKLFSGIRYIQCVGWQPPIPMSVMIHPFADFTPEEALSLAGKVLDQDIARIGELTLA